jgi:hypothetical protein
MNTDSVVWERQSLEEGYHAYKEIGTVSFTEESHQKAGEYQCCELIPLCVGHIKEG